VRLGCRECKRKEEGFEKKDRKHSADLVRPGWFMEWRHTRPKRGAGARDGGVEAIRGGAEIGRVDKTQGHEGVQESSAGAVPPALATALV
jgi:hypothetical protein